MKLWYYIAGYVIIEVKGFSAERFINIALKKGIDFCCLRPSPSGIILRVRVKDFKRLKDCCKKTKCRVIIKKRGGLPFFVHKNRKRYLFFAGVFVFIALLYTLSSFIWQINIEGNKTVTDAEILAFCSKNGFEVGTYKKNIDTRKLINALKGEFPALSWASVRIEGTLATIKIAEAIPPLRSDSGDEPCNIIASHDGVISKIVTSKGTPMVKSGDVVKKGDILVSGELVIKDDETGIIKDYVHSYADIKANQWYNITIDVPLSYEQKKYTGNSKKFYSVRVLENKIEPNFLKNRIYFQKYDTIIAEKQFSASKKYPLPIFLYETMYKEYELIPQTLTEEQAKEIAESRLNGEMIGRFSKSCEILNKEITFTKIDSSLRLSAAIAVDELIGEVQYISEGSSTDGAGKNTDTE